MVSLQRRFDVLLTAQEAYRALEVEFLEAQHDIIAGFRVFDPWTTLRSDRARAIGTTWFDLIVNTLNRGVRFDLTLSDFDPVVRCANHVDTWKSLRALHAAAQASDNPQLLAVRAAMHPARVGLFPRIALWPRSRREINETLQDLVPDGVEPEAFLQHAPALRPLVKTQNGRLRAKVFPAPPLVPVTHHQKLAVFDEERLYIGGLDLNDRRYDTVTHERDAPQTWHDTQVIVDGPIAQEAVQHLRDFQSITRGRPATNTAQLLRTISGRRTFAPMSLSPKPRLSELAQTHHDLAAKAKSLIYLESQFFRDRPFAEALAARALKNPDLNLILILPAAPEDAAFYNDPGSDVAYGEHMQTECLKIVKDAFGARVFVGSPAQRSAAPKDLDQDTPRATLCGAPIIYLHAKVSIFDDTAGIVSSANLNGRSFNWDTEAGVATQSSREARTLRKRCFEHWQEEDLPESFYELGTARSAWAERARQNAESAPRDRIGLILPYDAAPALELASNLPGVPEEMV